MNILVLTSTENFVWLSMQEIIPYIEHIWKTLPSDQVKIEVVNIDQQTLPQMLPKILQANRIVSTCFNFKMCKILKFIRQELRLEIPMIHHVHNMATIAFWPFRVLGSRSLFRQHDSFVVTCDRDLENMKLVAPKARVFKIPFSLIQPIDKIPAQEGSKVQQFVSVGRISPQKNLHLLLLAYSILDQKFGDLLPPLRFYGGEDHLGSPNMNLKNQNYLQFLQELTKKLSLETKVQFLGHRDRLEIRKALKDQRTLLISPSLHSDENFGMVVLQALLLNTDCVISDWGGYADFKKYFPEHVKLVPVQQSSWGPAIHAQQLAEIVEQKWQECAGKKKEGELPSYYSLEHAHQVLSEIVKGTMDDSELHFSDLANQILERVTSPTNGKSQMQIFDSFKDPLFHRISSTYLNAETQVMPHLSRGELVPWVEQNETEYVIRDPHKGNDTISKSGEAELKLRQGGYLL